MKRPRLTLIESLLFVGGLVLFAGYMAGIIVVAGVRSL